MDSRSSQIPSNIGRFRIEALLGSGGMGEVYKAFDPTLQRTVAVKTVRPDIDRPDFLDRLYREAQACARLQHPNIVTVFEAGEFGGIVYIAMEYLKGDSLSTVLRRGDLTFDAKLRILMQILDALQHAHSEDVVHRDIKPSNVNIQPSGSIKLLDFGLARMVRAETMTMSGAIMGTPHYASPEQLRGERVDARTDIYSTGALAYEMFSGRRPFEADNDSVATILFKVLSENPAPIETTWSRRFPEIQDIVAKAMAKAPEERYQTAAEMRGAFEEFLTTRREAITVALTESQAAAQRAIVEARQLMADGQTVEAQTLLENALRENPEASPVRTLLDESRSPRPLPPFPAPTPAPVTPAPVAPTFATTGGVTPLSLPSVEPSPMLSEDFGVGSIAPPVADEAPRRMPKAIWWALGGVAVLALAVGIGLYRNRQTGDGGTTVQATPPPIATPDSPGGTTTPAAAGERAADAAATLAPSAAAATTAPPASSTSNVAAPSTATASAKPPAAGATDTPASAVAPPPPPGTTETPAKPAAAMTAKQMFTATGSGGTPNAGLKYRLVQQVNNRQSDADPRTEFRSGDRVKFAFESNIDGYLYVATEGSTGRWTVLFPNPEINGGLNAIKRGQPYMVPNDAWFEFDENPGVEKIFVFLSREPLSVLPGFNKPVTGTVETPAAVVDKLQNSVQSRDLFIQRDRTEAGGIVQQATYVVNRDEVGKAVTAFIQLIHK
jgi:serine/threonine-protein kinase